MAGDDEPGPWGQPGKNDPPRPPRGSVPGGGPTGSGGGFPGGGFSGGTRKPIDWAAQSPEIAAMFRRFSSGGGGRGRGGGWRGRWMRGGRGLALIAIVFIAIWLASGLYRVEPDEAGVVQRFGEFVRLTPPGLNYHLPWPIESVQLPAVTRINRVEIGYRSANPASDSDDATAAGEIPAESLMLTGDENIIDINFAVFWRINDASQFLFNTRDPAATIKDVAESVMREVIGRTPIQPALTDARASIEADVLAKSQAILDRYGAGVLLSQVQLLKVDPPSEVIDSFRDVQRANTEAERMVNEAQSYANNIVPRARGDAAVITAGGDADRQATIARATGDAARFTSVLAAYQQSKTVTMQRLYIETMQDLLSHAPTIVIDGQMKNLLPLLPLGDAAKPTTGTTPTGTMPTGTTPTGATP